MARADAIRQGSFRGAPFRWKDSETDLGRRIVKHEFPLRDKPYGEDLGRKAREFTLNVFVVGDNWQAERDAVIRACEAAGPGRLVHPQFGEMTVVVTLCRHIESSDAVGRADLQLAFFEAGDISFAASAVQDTRFTLTSRADAASQAARDDFADGFSVAGAPDFVVAANSLDLTNSLKSLRAIAGRLNGAAGMAAIWQAQLAGVLAIPNQFLAAPTTLASTLSNLIHGASFLGDFGTGSLTDSWSDLIHGQAQADTTSAAPYDAVRRTQLAIAGIGLPASPTATTASRALQAANQAALLALIRQSALVEAAQAASATPFASADQAASVLDDLADRLDAEMQATGNDAVFNALSDLRIALVRDLTARMIALPRLLTVTPATTLPALVLAHSLYDDPSFAADIVSRNGIRHPGFIPGGQPLKVLTNA